VSEMSSASSSGAESVDSNSGDQLDFSTKSELLDGTFLIDGKRIHAGKQYLLLHSSYFAAIFHGSFKESEQDEIELKDVTYEEFHEMLRVIYPPSKDVTDDFVESLLVLGDRYGIKMLLDKSEAHLIKTEKFTIPEKLLLSENYRLYQLQDACFATLDTKEDVEDLKKTEEYAKLSDACKENIEEIKEELDE
ncbi:hypothetical protein PFISCL1PPCAC_22289, partial [Pristionchus fissidentatus]